MYSQPWFAVLRRPAGRFGAHEITNLEILGTNGDDTIAGTRRSDVIEGLVGNDRIDGNGDWDYIWAGQGDDRVSGGAGETS